MDNPSWIDQPSFLIYRTYIIESVLLVSPIYTKKYEINPAIKLLLDGINLHSPISKREFAINFAKNREIHVSVNLDDPLWSIVFYFNNQISSELPNFTLEFRIIFPVFDEIFHIVRNLVTQLNTSWQFLDKHSLFDQLSEYIDTTFEVRPYYLVFDKKNRKTIRFSKFVLDFAKKTKESFRHTVEYISSTWKALISIADRKFFPENIKLDAILTYLITRLILPIEILPTIRFNEEIVTAANKFLETKYNMMKIQYIEHENIKLLASNLNIYTTEVSKN